MTQDTPPEVNNTLDKFRADFRQLRKWALRVLKQIGANLTEVGEPIAKPLFAINRPSALIRNSIFVAGFLLWTGYAYITNPPNLSEQIISIPTPTGDETSQLIVGMIAQLQALLNTVIALIMPYFAAGVLRHVIPILLAFWVSYRWAAIYLDDIFELDDVSVAEGFILQAAFASRYNRILLLDGDIAPESRNSPVFRIGGPGLVRVQLENVGLAEKIDGEPQVLGPSPQYIHLEGFERMRTVIDLRDQFIDDIEVTGRTKDGIQVTAKDFRAILSVHRNPEPENEENTAYRPLSYTDEAVKNLVYTKSNRPWQENARGSLQSQLRRFIAQHTLNEFFANVSPQEREEVEEQLRRVPVGSQATNVQSDDFKSRDEITSDFYKQFETGPETFDLQWLGVGTWVTPDVIPEKHLEAWLKSIQNQYQSSEKVLNRLRRDNRIKELLRLIQDVPINAFGMLMNQGRISDDLKRELILAYREKIKNAADYIEQDPTRNASQELKVALRFLESI